MTTERSGCPTTLRRVQRLAPRVLNSREPSRVKRFGSQAARFTGVVRIDEIREVELGACDPVGRLHLLVDRERVAVVRFGVVGPVEHACLVPGVAGDRADVARAVEVELRGERCDPSVEVGCERRLAQRERALRRLSHPGEPDHVVREGELGCLGLEIRGYRQARSPRRPAHSLRTSNVVERQRRGADRTTPRAMHP